MAKKAYIGIDTKFPIYDTTIANVSITANNISTHFTVTNSSYYFVGSGSKFTTNNGGVHNSTAQTILTAKSDCDISFSYTYASEPNYDKFTLIVAGTTIENAVSGVATTKTYSGSLKTGDQITFKYAKDLSGNSNGDACSFQNMVITTTTTTTVITGYETKTVVHKIKKIYIGKGIENSGTARKVKKAYVGIGGVARPCFGGNKKLIYHGMAENLPAVIMNMSSATVGNLCIFGQGTYKTGSNNYFGSFISYNDSLTYRWLLGTTGYAGGAGTNNSKYAIIGGGRNADKTSNHLFCFNESGTCTQKWLSDHKHNGLRAARAGDYALFAGGISGTTRNYTNTVDAFDASLTRSSAPTLDTTTGNSESGGGSIHDKAIFLNRTTTANAYDASLTKSSLQAPTVTPQRTSSASVGDYLLFAGGSQTGTSVFVYDKSLTKRANVSLSQKRLHCGASSVGAFALFAGGSTTTSYSGNISTVDVFDESLTRTLAPERLSAKVWQVAGGKVGNYALFAGGQQNTNNKSSYVDVYTTIEE